MRLDHVLPRLEHNGCHGHRRRDGNIGSRGHHNIVIVRREHLQRGESESAVHPSTRDIGCLDRPGDKCYTGENLGVVGILVQVVVNGGCHGVSSRVLSFYRLSLTPA